MKKNDYLALLNSHLTGLPENEKIEIILDFEEHFSAGLAKGKTEEEICEDLGDPIKNAEQYVAGSMPRGYIGTVPPVVATAGSYQGAAYTAPVQPSSKSSSQTTFLVLFILSVLFTVFMYMTFVPVLVSGGAVLVSGVAAGAVVGSWIVTALLISLGIFIMALSLLILLSLTWLCIYLYRRYSQDKGVTAQ